MTTDIDRKLAIYYHPLFQQIIKNIVKLFNQPGDDIEIGLLEFIEFNLKLQKALLPTFERENAMVSGLNDWVKEVAECLTYEGMVSTARCVDITSENFTAVLEREMEDIKIDFYTSKEEYMKNMVKLSSHDAFKLLGVRINKQVFSKFMFDLCSTWCQFLDVELFSYFLLGIYVQISTGPSLQESYFRKTSDITAVQLQFMEEFQTLKNSYNRNRKKQLRYYRAWCEWNYLRVNDIGQALILQLDQVHPDDSRILQIALIFEKSIQVINEEITNQNPKEIQQQKSEVLLQREPEKEQDFLILKKLDIGPSKEITENIREVPSKNPIKEFYEQEFQDLDNQQDF